jgi:hypothetical protein
VSQEFDLRAAVEAAGPGDTVTIPPGKHLFKGPIQFASRGVKIRPAEGHVAKWRTGVVEVVPGATKKPSCPHCGRDL